MTTIYQATDIFKYYPRSNFKLEVPKLQLDPGSITGVVGENGNGKTTLLNIVAGNLSQKNTSFMYFDKTPKTANDWSNVKDKIAFIPQRIPKWYGSLLQNLQLKAAVEGIPNEDIDSELDKIINFLGLTKYKHLKWSEISTGYRLRFELARVLIGKPQLLVLDEPIANLDINAQQQFLSDLKEIAESKEYPIAVILSSQQLHEIETIATQMIFLKEGKALFSGDLESLKSTNNTIEILVNENDKLVDFLHTKNYKFTKRGVYFQVDIDKKNSNIFIKELIDQEININYYRDISKSTKKLF